MSKTYTRDEVVQIIKELAYFSATDFTGGYICLDKDDVGGCSSPGNTMYSNMLGKALTILEICLTGKQLEAAKSQMRDSLAQSSFIARDGYQNYVRDIINPNISYGYGSETPAGRIMAILNK